MYLFSYVVYLKKKGGELIYTKVYVQILLKDEVIYGFEKKVLIYSF